jgi:hypothetical protein
VLPRGFDPASRFEAVKRWIERTRFNLEQIFRGLLDALGDRVAVRGSKEKRTKNQKVEGSLEELDATGALTSHCVGILLFIV